MRILLLNWKMEIAREACFLCTTELRSDCKPNEDFLAVSFMNGIYDDRHGIDSEKFLPNPRLYHTNLQPLLAASQETNRIDIEMSVREKILIRLYQNIDASEKITDEEYQACFTKYLSKLNKIDPWFEGRGTFYPENHLEDFSPKKHQDLPLLENRILLKWTMECTSFLGKTDVLGRTLFQVGLYQGAGSDCERYLDRYKDVSINDLNLDKIDHLGLAAIHLAAIQGFDNIIRKLLQKGASADTVGFSNRTAMHFAAENGQIDTVRALLEGIGNHDSKDEDSMTPLMLAASKGHFEVARLLLNHGADFLQADKDGATPLSFAAVEGHSEVFKLLLDRGVDPAPVKARGDTLISFAAKRGYSEIVQSLLDHGVGPKQVNADAVDSSGWSPIFWAAHHGHKQTVEVLLKSMRINPKRKDNGGRSLEEVASNRGHHEVMNLLNDWKG